jgi:hypothetical protein
MTEMRKSKALPIILGAALIVVAAVAYFTMFAGGGSSAGGDHSYRIVVEGQAGTRFSGAIVHGGAGGVEERSVEGTVPAEYSARGMTCGATLQMQDSAGGLKVVLYRDGAVMQTAETSAAYGVVTVAG